MKFHEYVSQADVYRRDGSLPRGYSVEQFYIDIIQQCNAVNDSESNTKIQHGIAEGIWWSDCRPYYKAWPSITPSLTKIPLDINPKAASLDDKTILIRFAEGHEPIAGRSIIETILVSLLTVQEVQRLIVCGSVVTDNSRRHMMLPVFVLNGEETLEEYIRSIPGIASDLDKTNEDFENCERITEESMRLAFAVLLLADDPSIITPDVLAKDRDRYDNETDEAWKQRAVDRARRRGVVGWNIGADYEVCPHYRRPHFGLRHTGKGRTVPRIVPIKGAVVHRNRLTEVPTGWMTPDGREVEPVR